ncbi:MAG: cobalt transporter CbiM [Desulfosarcina sp.]|nr:cobalt transporter CbiM [Desulfobacterales bacterium]
MHISEGILSPSILAAGFALTAAGVIIGLKKTDAEDIPSVGIMSAAFFVASLVHVPIGPASVHLILNGLLGLLLGWKSFPAILTGLLLQALLFQFGGITSLGVNTFNMAFPAILCFYMFGWCIRGNRSRALFISASFASGFLSVLFSAILVALSLYLTGEEFLPTAKLIIIAHLPVMFIEGGLTAVCALFLKRVKPELLEGKDGAF